MDSTKGLPRGNSSNRFDFGVRSELGFVTLPWDQPPFFLMKRFLATVCLLAITQIAGAEDLTPTADGKSENVIAGHGIRQTSVSFEAIVDSMRRATAFYRTKLAFAGGYGSKWSPDLTEAYGEKRVVPRTYILIQPPGTPSVGMAMLKAWWATEDPLFLQGAREAAGALMWCQMASGGWGDGYDFNRQIADGRYLRRDVDAGDLESGERGNTSSLDDNKTQAALLLLLELAHSDGGRDDAGLRHALNYGLEGLLTAQAPNGGWAQHFSGPFLHDSPDREAQVPRDWPRTFPGANYRSFYTLNDDVFLNTIRLLLRAWELEEDPRFLEAAKQSGDFLIRAQLPEPHPVWAQQYNHRMQPAWARKYEPPAACSRESLGALEALRLLWVATGEERFAAPIPPALDWFAESRLEGEEPRWARFHELLTNRPLYCRAGTYELTYGPVDLPTHYDFVIGYEFHDELEAFRSRFEAGRDWKAKADPEELRESVSNALATQSPNGIWHNEEGLIDAALFVEHIATMCEYLASVRTSD